MRVDAASVGDAPIERLADEHLARWAQLEPCDAAGGGLAGSETELTHSSPVGDAATRDHLRSRLAALAALCRTSVGLAQLRAELSR